MEQTRFWNLLAKKISGEATPEELLEFEQLIKLHPDWAYQAEHIYHFWQPKNESNGDESEKAFQQHLNKMKEAGIDFPDASAPELPLQPAGLNRKKVYAFSFAAVVLFLVAGLLWFNKAGRTSAQAEEKNYSEVSAPMRSRTKLVLPDSTVVWLNAGSKLTYNENFGTTNRNTTLVGEAYFDVRKTSVPFIIHANNVHIKVLGTEFNVKAYPGEKTTETSLVRGRVEITLDKRPGVPFILEPNEKLVVANEEAEKETRVYKTEPIVAIQNLTHIDDSTIVETSWVNNKLIFHDETFSGIARKMERWYGVTIKFEEDAIANERLSGTFTNENVQEALNALQLATKFHYSMKGNVITITQ